jgi:hypothetical protein
MINTRFLTIYDNNSSRKNENESINNEMIENRKSFRANNQHHVNFREPLHGTRTILKVKAMPSDLNSIERNSIQRHEINSFSRSLSSYNINTLTPRTTQRPVSRRHHNTNNDISESSNPGTSSSSYSNMATNPYGVKLPINRLDNTTTTTTNRNKSHCNSKYCRHNKNNEIIKKVENNKQLNPSMQLDLEINTPRNDIKISRRCKSYEVRFYLFFFFAVSFVVGRVHFISSIWREHFF